MKRILAVLFVVAAPLSAQNPDLPPMVAEGFQAMVAEGPVAAIDIWAAAWTSDSESINKAQLSNSFADIWETLGGASSFEILTINAIGTRVLEIYAISVHEAQPLYLNLDAYRSESGWRMTGLYAHTSNRRGLSWVGVRGLTDSVAPPNMEFYSPGPAYRYVW